MKSTPPALIQLGATARSFLAASPAVPARISPTHQLGARLPLPYPLHLSLLPWEEGWALLQMCRQNAFYYLLSFSREKVGCWEEKLCWGNWFRCPRAALVPRGAPVPPPGLWEAKTSGQLYQEGPPRRGKLCSSSRCHGDGKCSSAEMAAQWGPGKERPEIASLSQTQDMLL